MPKNLFGEEQPIPDLKKLQHEGKIQKLKRQMGYRKANVYKKEQWCKFCNNFIRYHYHDKVYLKCDLIGISNATTTDIRAKYTCNKWSK